MKEEFRKGHGMAEVISWGSAVFSMGLDFVWKWPSHESWHSWHFAKMSKSHSPLALSLGSSHGSHTSSLRDESGALREKGPVGWWNICHCLMALFTASIDMEIRKVWFANSEHGRGEEVCRGKSYVCWKWNWAEYLTFLTLLPPVSVQVGFSLSRPSPGSPLVSGVDNPVGDRGHTVDSHRYFAFNWRLTSTYIPDQVLFSFGRSLSLTQVSFSCPYILPHTGSSSTHLMHFDRINFQVTNSIILNFPAFSVVKPIKQS